MKNVLITGSSGFIGGTVHIALQKLGWHVVGIGRRPSKLSGYYQHDCTVPLTESKHKEIANGQFDVVIHAAARSSPWGRKSEFENANVLATKLLLEHFSKRNSPKFIFISSPSVFYRPEHQFEITETSSQPHKPVNLYAATKKKAEQLVRSYSGPIAILRPRAVFGPGDTVLFPRILKAAKARRFPLIVAERPVIGDLIYIENLVDQIVKCAESEIEGEYNLTNKEPVEIIQFLMGVFDRLNIERPLRKVSMQMAFRVATILESLYWFLPNKEPPITRFGVHVFAYCKTFDVSKMVDAFGNPRISIDEGVERFVDWIQREEPYG